MEIQTRSDSLKAASVLSLGMMSLNKGFSAEALESSRVIPSNEESLHRWKGRLESLVLRWDIVTIGNLSRNRYWGESDEKAVRPAICTCTVLSGKGSIYW